MKVIMNQLFPAENKLQFVPPKIIKKNSFGFEVDGANIVYKNANVWGQMVGPQLLRNEENSFRFKIIRCKYNNANICIGVVDLNGQNDLNLDYATCIFYLGGSAQVWIGDPKKNRFFPTKGTAFTRGDIVTMSVDLKKGDISWYINGTQN